MYCNTITLIFISLIVYLIWRRKKSLSYFERHGIPYIKPNFIFGNLAGIFKGKRHSDLYCEFYRQLHPHKIAGIYNMHVPEFIVRDPQLSRNILIKDFEYFQDHPWFGVSDDEIFSKNLFLLKGEKWRNLRIKLTAMFTTGKMKMMFPLVDKCGQTLSNVLNTAAVNRESLEISEILSRFGIDAIASCVFGIETNCLTEQNIEILRMTRRIFAFRIQMMLFVLWPKIPKKLAKLLNLTFVDNAVANYFKDIAFQAIKHREENNITRNDFIDLAIALKNNTMQKKYQDKSEKEDLEKLLVQMQNKPAKGGTEITDDLLTAQSIGFFSGGADTIPSILALCILELAQHPDIQDKVRDEINSSIEANHGKITYDLLRNMPYTDMVFAEILRKYPPTVLISRECVKDYKVPNTDIVIPAGTYLHVPLTGLHNDATYYEKPDDFYPQHFTEEAKARRPNFTYLPFGDGPRICIGERFAKMKLKVGLIYMLKDFAFSVSPKMKLPYEWTTDFGFKVKGGIWLQCEKIKN